MDHLRKALEKADSAPANNSTSTTVRDWMQPVREGNPGLSPSVKVQNNHVVQTHAQSLIDNRLIAASNQHPAVLDRYRVLRTRLQQIFRAQNWRVLGITSATPEAGKTLTTLNLGITFARTDTQRIIVVDADMRKPSTASMFGITAEKGLAEYLSGEAELSEILYQPAGFPNLSLIPGAGQRLVGVANPSELLASGQFDALMKSLRGTGAMILIDTPPLQVGDDVLSIAQRTDCFLLVIEEGKNTAADITDAARQLRDYNLIGTVLNKSSEPPKKFQSYYASEDNTETAKP